MLALFILVGLGLPPSAMYGLAIDVFLPYACILTKQETTVELTAADFCAPSELLFGHR